MVLLTMTPGVVRAIDEARRVAPDEFGRFCTTEDPPLADAAVGNPISHGQLIGLAKLLRKHADQVVAHDDNDAPISYSLDSLLKGCKFHIPPPPPKKEPTPEYKALMARLRREEEARAYERMLKPPAAPETFAQRFPASPLPHQVPIATDFDDDDISYEEVHRQMILIINVLVSIVACSVFIWVAARHWSAPKRLGLSMGGSGIVAAAEVIIYHGYIRRVKEAKLKERKKPEIKEIIESWVIEPSSDKKPTALVSEHKEKPDDGVRFRKGKHR